MEDHVLEQTMKKSIARVLGIGSEKITLQSVFSDDLGADSLDMLEIIMALEDDLDVSISDEDADRIKTVKQAFNFLRTKI